MGRQLFTHACHRCAAPFVMNTTQLARLRKDPKAAVFCSRACAGTEPQMATCIHCATTFHPNQIQRARLRQGGEIYCSRDCFIASRITYRCASCSTVFATSAHQRRMMRKSGAPILCGTCKHLATDKASVAATTDAWMHAAA